MKEYLILIILALGFSYWAAKSEAFSWATSAAVLLGLIIALGGIIALIFNFFGSYIMNPILAIAIIVVCGFLITAWLVDKKTEVFVPRNYLNNFLIIIYEVKGAKKIWPSLTSFPRTYKLIFPQTGIITTSEKPYGSCFYYTMCEVLEENGNLYLPNKDSRYFFSTSEIHNGFHLDILYLDETSPSNNNVRFNFLDYIDFTKFEKIKEN